jgi:hypothetical protein
MATTERRTFRVAPMKILGPLVFNEGGTAEP